MLDLCMRYERIGRRCEATKSRTKGRSGHEVPNPVIESFRVSACRRHDGAGNGTGVVRYGPWFQSLWRYVASVLSIQQ